MLDPDDIAHALAAHIKEQSDVPGSVFHGAKDIENSYDTEAGRVVVAIVNFTDRAGTTFTMPIARLADAEALGE